MVRDFPLVLIAFADPPWHSGQLHSQLSHNSEMRLPVVTSTRVSYTQCCVDVWMLPPAGGMRLGRERFCVGLVGFVYSCTIRITPSLLVPHHHQEMAMDRWPFPAKIIQHHGRWKPPCRLLSPSLGAWGNEHFLHCPLLPEFGLGLVCGARLG